MGNATLTQERDMHQLRTDHELEIERLLMEIESAVMDLRTMDKLGAKTRLRVSLRPLLDAAYGPVRDASPVKHIYFPPVAVCSKCDGHGFYAVNTHGTGEDAVEVACEVCNGGAR